MQQNWETLERLFSEALELPGEQRLRFVQEQSGDNPWLRHELESLLRVPESKSDAAFDSGTGIVHELLNALDIEYAVGREVGGYRIESLISSGGMGIVYRAVKLTSGEPVALKLLPPEDSRDAQRMRRLAREASALRMLNHPGIVKIKQYRAQPGCHFLAMELIEGDTLRSLLSHGPIPLCQALEWSVQIASAVDAAHQRGVVHRDLKPSNIMVEGSSGKVKLLDFGLARITDATHSGQTQTTVDGSVAGTFSYFSPEQANGGRGDERSDIFSFGAILYEMIAGRRAFDRPGPLATAAAVLTEQPDPLPPRVPQPVKALIDHCLEKDPARRFGSMRSVAEAIENLLSLARRGELKPAIAKKTRMAITATCALAGALAIGCLLRIQPPPPDTTPSVAILPFTNVSGDPASQTLVDDFRADFTSELSTIKSLRVATPLPTAALRKAPLNLRAIGRKLKASYLVEASFESTGDRIKIVASLDRSSDGVRLWTNTYQRPSRYLSAIGANLASAVGVSLNQAAPVKPARRFTPSKQAYDLFQKARYEDNQYTPAANALAQQDYRRAIELQPDYALAYGNLCSTIWSENIVAGRRPVWEERMKAEQYCRKALELNSGLSWVHGMMAMFAMQYDWDWNRAERELQIALAAGPDAGAECHYAYLCLVQGRREEADRHLRRAQEIDPLSPTVAHDTVNILILEGRYDDLYQEASKLASGPNTMQAQFALNGSIAQSGRYDVAIRNLRALLPQHPEVAMDLAVYEASAGNRENALRLVRSLERNEQKNQMLRYWFARPYAAMGDEANTVKWLERSMDDREFVAIYIPVDPVFNSLQNTPAFHALKKRMNLDW